jgi:alpha-galactosidase
MANAERSSRTAWFARQIHQRGFKAGLWLAPFMIGAKSKLYRSTRLGWHYLRPLQAGKPGKPYVAMINWAQECYSMDLTRPDVLEWLEKVFTTVFDEWKFDYIKIDFLYAGAVDGIRSNPNVTRAQAYRRAIEKIREIAGERFILGCGHPMGPSIGIVNGSRISPDVAAFW